MCVVLFPHEKKLETGRQCAAVAAAAGLQPVRGSGSTRYHTPIVVVSLLLFPALPAALSLCSSQSSGTEDKGCSEHARLFIFLILFLNTFIWKSCKNSRDFPCALSPASLDASILHSNSIFIEIKKLVFTINYLIVISSTIITITINTYTITF